MKWNPLCFSILRYLLLRSAHWSKGNLPSWTQTWKVLEESWALHLGSLSSVNLDFSFWNHTLFPRDFLLVYTDSVLQNSLSLETFQRRCLSNKWKPGSQHYAVRTGSWTLPDFYTSQTLNRYGGTLKKWANTNCIRQHSLSQVSGQSTVTLQQHKLVLHVSH